MSQKQVIIDKKILTGCDPRRCLDPVFIVMCVRVLRRRCGCGKNLETMTKYLIS